MDTFDFSEALKRIKAGRCVRRTGWNGKGMRVYLEDSLVWIVPGGVFKGQRRKYDPVIVLFTSAGTHQPGWICSQADLLANDWQEVPPEEL